MASSKRTIQDRGCDIVTRTCCVKNGLAVGVILLFIGIAVQPCVATVKSEKEINVEPKDFLFQTIIDIANNLDVKELFEQYKNEFLKVDIDQSIYLKIFFRNPRIFLNMIFTKPSIKFDYLDKRYNAGLEILNIIREDKIFELIKSIELSKPKVLDRFLNIVINNKDIYDKIIKLNEYNVKKEAICFILFMIIIPSFSLMVLFVEILGLNPTGLIWDMLFGIPSSIFMFLVLIPLALAFFLGCIDLPGPY